MLDRIKFDTITMLSKIQVRSQAEIEREELERQQRLSQALQLQHAEAVSPIQPGPPGPGPGESGGFPSAAPPPDLPPISESRAGAVPFVRQVPKVGRNEMCPCGSGKKYKHCHGALQQASG
jgi:preprotein translocase subunit SecA